MVQPQSVVATGERSVESAGGLKVFFRSWRPMVPLRAVVVIVPGLSHLAPHAHILHPKNEDFSRDPEVVEAMNADPLIAHETQPTRTLAAMVRADERLKEGFPLITLPVLILHGTADKATRLSGSQFFYDTAGSSDKTLKLYEGHVHDLLNDLGKDVVMADIKGW